MQMGDSYIKVWVCVMARLDEETSYGQISKGANVSKSQTYRAVQWGVNQLIDMGVSVSVQSTDNFIVISIGKSVATAIQKVEKPAEEKEHNNMDMIKQIIDYLNAKTNRSYTTKAKDAVRAINARIKEGHKAEDFKKVIDIKVEKWMGTDMEDYLRPITLFGTKFNSYINERPTADKPTNQSQIARTLDTAAKVASELGGLYEE